MASIIRMGEGLVKVIGTAELPVGIWSRCKARKHHKCAWGGSMILPGEMCYRPITNRIGRAKRLAERLVDHLAEAPR